MLTPVLLAVASVLAGGLAAVTGLLGGLVGNQGGIRTAAMLGFDVPKEAFVATATAVALFVDGARVPVYLATQGRNIADIWPLVLTATVGVVIGTAVGTRVLGRLPPRCIPYDDRRPAHGARSVHAPAWR